MKKKVLLLTLTLLLAFAAGAMAATGIKVVVNGKTAKTDAKLINNTTYVPLRAVSEMLGAKVDWDNKTKTVNITNGQVPAESQTVKTIEGITVAVTKVEQDSDSLRVYVKYTNNTNEQAMTGDSLAKVVFKGKQYAYDSDFNFERWYETGVPHADDFIEAGVTEESVIFFEPIPNVTSINIVLNANFEDYRFNTIPVK
jgi:hypothetical protein